MPAPPTFVCALLLCLAACAATESAEPEIRLVHLEHVPPAEVAIQLRPLLPADASLDLLELPGLNAILLRGSPSECAALTTEIHRLDRSGRD